MQLKRLFWVVAVLLLTTVLTSCNIGKSPEPTADVNAIFTSAAGTMIAQLNDQQTQTALAVPPTSASSPTPLDTFTPLPTFAQGSTVLGTPFLFNTPGTGLTPLAPLATIAPTTGSGSTHFAVGCNDAEFTGENMPDGTIVTPAKRFEKWWMLQNVGTCTWDEGYSFDFKSGDQLNGDNKLITKNSDKSEFTAPGHSQSFIVQMWAPGTAGEYKGYWQMKSDSGQWFGSIVSVDIQVHR
jgi:hypothetical protein